MTAQIDIFYELIEIFFISNLLVDYHSATVNTNKIANGILLRENNKEMKRRQPTKKSVIYSLYLCCTKNEMNIQRKTST